MEEHDQVFRKYQNASGEGRKRSSVHGQFNCLHDRNGNTELTARFVVLQTQVVLTKKKDPFNHLETWAATFSV